MKSVLILVAVSLVAACGEVTRETVKEPWTQAQIDGFVSLCKTPILEKDAPLGDAEATQYCNCLLNVIRSKYSSDQYSADPIAIEQDLLQAGAFDSCS